MQLNIHELSILIHDWFSSTAVHWIPFIGTVKRGDSRGAPLVTRWIENSIPAIMLAALLLWRNDALQDQRETQAQHEREVAAQERKELTDAVDSLRQQFNDLLVTLATNGITKDERPKNHKR